MDFQRDQSVADVLRSTGAGMRSVEHIKRYTSISTANDQGKTSGVNAIGVIAAALRTAGEASRGIGDIGTTTYRAPFTPVAFAALAGRQRGELFDPARITSIHPWHVAKGALFEDVGQWKRPWYYPQAGEDMDAAVLRECAAVRESVGFMDATTLGKIEIRGKDAGEFLNRIYTNAFKKLAPGSARYGVMCMADGMIFDDGVTLRLDEDRYFMTTTTGGAAKVLDWLEEWLQTEWPELDVHCTSVTEQWTTIAVVGPKSRAVLAKLAPELAADGGLEAEAFPFMTFRETTLASGVQARICRISFSGELAYEINVPSWYGLNTWEAVAAAGAEFNITPYGTETMHVLRAEKGYPIVGQDTDGTVTPQDAGMEWIVSKAKDFIGKRSYARKDAGRTDRKHLVSVLPVDGTIRLPEGTQLVEKGITIRPRLRPGPHAGLRDLELPQCRPGTFLWAGTDQEWPQPHRREPSWPPPATSWWMLLSQKPYFLTPKGPAKMANTAALTGINGLRDIRRSPASHLAEALEAGSVPGKVVLGGRPVPDHGRGPRGPPLRGRHRGSPPLPAACRRAAAK